MNRREPVGEVADIGEAALAADDLGREIGACQQVLGASAPHLLQHASRIVAELALEQATEVAGLASASRAGSGPWIRIDSAHGDRATTHRSTSPRTGRWVDNVRTTTSAGGVPAKCSGPTLGASVSWRRAGSRRRQGRTRGRSNERDPTRTRARHPEPEAGDADDQA